MESSRSSSSVQSLRSFGMYTPLYRLKCWLLLRRLANCLIMFLIIVGVFTSFGGWPAFIISWWGVLVVVCGGVCGHSSGFEVRHGGQVERFS